MHFVIVSIQIGFPSECNINLVYVNHGCTWHSLHFINMKMVFLPNIRWDKMTSSNYYRPQWPFAFDYYWLLNEPRVITRLAHGTVKLNILYTIHIKFQSANFYSIGKRNERSFVVAKTKQHRIIYGGRMALWNGRTYIISLFHFFWWRAKQENKVFCWFDDEEEEEETVNVIKGSICNNITNEIYKK